MRIALVASIAPFVHDDDRRVIEDTASALKKTGHQADIVLLPFVRTISTLVRQLTAYRTLDLADLVDAAVCFDSPAHLVRHPRKIAWYQSRSTAVTSPMQGPLEESVRGFERAAMDESSRIFAGSEHINRQLRDVDHVDSSLLLARSDLDAEAWSIVIDRLLE